MLLKNLKTVAVLMLLVVFIAGCAQQQAPSTDDASTDNIEAELNEDIGSLDSEFEDFDSDESDFEIEDFDLEVGL